MNGIRDNVSSLGKRSLVSRNDALMAAVVLEVDFFIT